MSCSPKLDYLKFDPITGKASAVIPKWHHKEKELVKPVKCALAQKLRDGKILTKTFAFDIKSTPYPVDCKHINFKFNEAATKNRCATDCHCDGARTCSTHKYCQGTSRPPVKPQCPQTKCAMPKPPCKAIKDLSKNSKGCPAYPCGKVSCPPKPAPLGCAGQLLAPTSRKSWASPASS